MKKVKKIEPAEVETATPHDDLSDTCHSCELQDAYESGLEEGWDAGYEMAHFTTMSAVAGTLYDAAENADICLEESEVAMLVDSIVNSWINGSYDEPTESVPTSEGSTPDDET